MRKLPTFRGYTLDDRLGEFRKMKLGEVPEFVPFSSEKGQRLLAAYLDKLEQDALKRRG